MEVSKVFLDIITRARGGRDVDKLADSMGDLGKSMADSAGDAKTLDKHISATKASIAGLAREIRSTGNLDLFKDLRKQQGELRRFEGLKKVLDQAGVDGAGGFATQFSARLGPLLARMPVSPYLLAALAPAIPAVGAAVGAAVLGGLTGGVVAAGVAGAMRDARVQAAAEATGKDLGDRMGQATRSFIPATINALSIVREQFTQMEGDLRAVFDKAAVYVEPLTRALAGAVQAALPGIADGLEEAAPVIRSLESGAKLIGAAFGDAMDSIGDGAAGAGLLVSDLAATIASSVQMVGKTIGWLSQAYALMRGVFSMNKQGVVQEMALGKAAAASYKSQFDELANAFRNGGSAANSAAAEVRSLDEILNGFADATTTAFNAQTKFGQVLDEITRKAANHGAGISANTAKGRENREMLSQLATQTRESSSALAGMAGGQARANQIMDEGYRRFVSVAMSMGMSRQKADELARSLGLIPKRTDPKVKTQGVQTSINDARRIEAKLEALERTYFPQVKVVYWDNPRNPLLEAARGGGQMGRASTGGPVTPGRTYLVGEKGPELIRTGSSTYVTPSHRARVGAAAGGSGGGMSADDIGRALASAMSGMTVVMDGRAVGRVQGETAYTYARGG